MWLRVDALPSEQILYSAKLKRFVDDKINVTQKLNMDSVTVENIVGKEENAGISIFSFFHNVSFILTFKLQ